MYNRILMPTDGSACSDTAIRDGLGLAQQLGGEVVFLHAMKDPNRTVYAADIIHYPELYAAMKDAGLEALERVRNWAREAGIPAKTVLVESKRPAAAIHEAARDVDLIVMGTHGRTGFHRLAFGSVAEEVLRSSSKPCLMIRSDPDPEAG